MTFGAPEARDSRRLRILIVDDDEDDFLIARDLLADGSALRHEVAWARTFEEGVEQLQIGHFDACVLDFGLGERTGLDFLRLVEARTLPVPVIMLTGREGRDFERRLVEAGASDYLMKARLDAERLERSLRYSIAHKRAESSQRLLAEAGRSLFASLEAEAILGAVARIPVPQLADWAVAFPSPEAREVPGRHFHQDESREGQVARLLELGFPSAESPAGRRLREEGLPTLVWDLAAASSPSSPEHGDLLAALGARSLVMVPLPVLGGVPGGLVLGRSSERPPFDARDLATAQGLAGLATQALENAANYRTTKEAVEARNEILSMVSHDLGNPLAAVVMVVERMLETLDTMDPRRVHRHLEMIQESAETMKRMVQDLLEVGRAEAGHFRMERRPQEIGPLVERTVRRFLEVAGREGIALEVTGAGEPCQVDADEVRIDQVVGNLLSNAMKFTPSSGHVRVNITPCADEVAVSVTDSGPGIDPKDLPRLFEPFWQARETRRGGAGLGLAIAREIVVAHGGRIWAESELGRGSTFHFALPISRPRALAP